MSIPDLNSQPAQEERALLNVTREQQRRSFAPPPPSDRTVVPTVFPGDNIRLANIIYGEASGASDAVKTMVGSTVLNRVDSGRIDEFGSTIDEVINSQMSPYYAASANSPQYQQARNQQFPDKISENAFKKSLQIANGLIRGTIPRHKGMFFFTGQEISGLKRRKKKSFDFKKVKETGKVGKYTTFSY